MQIQEFLARWGPAGGAERANCQPFIIDLCDLLGVPRPEPSVPDESRNAYVFDRKVTRTTDDGAQTPNFIDVYKRGCFVLETKQGVEAEAAEEEKALSEAGKLRVSALKRGHGRRGTRQMEVVMLRAKQQAERYARLLPPEEGRPPFLLVVDIGATIEVYSEFTRTGGVYTPFPDAASHRIPLGDLAKPEVQDRLRLIFTDPLALDPARRSARVTREIAAALAKLAQRLEAAGNDPGEVAQFLMRCLFTMFAEDVNLLPPNSFLRLLMELKSPANFRPMVEALWQTMNTGGFSPVIQEKLLRFNGGLFAEPYAIDLTADQVELLKEAAAAKWSEVEPAIFGTLLERALNPIERHKLGAHYTPRAYVERLVIPTVIEPLRAEWESVQAAAVRLDAEDKAREARETVEQFHQRLCQIRVLDPACGSGNFLYVSLELMKRLEGEVLDFLRQLEHTDQRLLQVSSVTVDPHQFLGIEINPRAAAIAELVLWIGYLQWHFRTHGNVMPPEPVIKNFHNIECRDAVLEYDAVEPVLDSDGNPVTRWDGRSMKTSPVTGEDIPDESQRTAVLRYVNPRKAPWPEAEFIVGNPPFIGTARMRDLLGEGYAESIRQVYKHIPESCDYVMYWWDRAAELAGTGRIGRFGLITTNSIRQTFNRRVIEAHLSGKAPVGLLMAIPDHPWVDAADGAAVRIAMTIAAPGPQNGLLCEVVSEEDALDDAAVVTFGARTGTIHGNLRIGADIGGVKTLKSNDQISCPGVKLHGSGFIISPDEASELGLGRIDGLHRHIRNYRNGKDLTATPRGVMAIDLFGLTESDVKRRFPEVFQWVFERVKPERDQNNRATYRDNWWLHGEPRSAFRPALHGLPRYIATVETSKHRFFVFLNETILPDNMLVVVALQDAYSLGVLSSFCHVSWALATGGRLGVGNDPRYNKTLCFETFPFPDPPSALRERIRDLGEQLDAHRKRQQALHPGLTMTGMYNVLEKLRSGEPLTPKERTIHEQGLVSVLKQIHDDLDDAVLEAYRWEDLKGDRLRTPEGVEELLGRLVALNHERAAEEARGIVRWLRPDFQNAGDTQQELAVEVDDSTEPVPAKKGAKGRKGETGPPPMEWPSGLLAQTQAVRAVLATARTPMDADAVARRFTRARRSRVEEILETLSALGQATRTAEGGYLAG